MSKVIIINRMDGGSGDRARTNGWRLQARNGATVTESVLCGWYRGVVEANFAAPFLAPALPAASDPTQVLNRQNWVRYVRITTTAANSLHYREFMVYDATWTNVARLKRCYSNRGVFSGMGSCAVTNDGIVHSGGQTFEGQDNAAGGLYHADVATTGSWVEYDLGGLYQVTKVVLFNRFLGQFMGGSATGGCCSTRMAGASISFRVRMRARPCPAAWVTLALAGW